MGWKVILKPYTLGVGDLDFWTETLDLYVGDQVTETSDVKVWNPETASYDIITEDYTIATNYQQLRIAVEPQTYIQNVLGKTLFFRSGPLKDLGAVIQKDVRLVSTNAIIAVYVDRLFPANPNIGDPLRLTWTIATGNASHINNIQLDKHISDITFSTDINIGFSTCNILLNEHATLLSRYFSYIPGMYAKIEDPYGFVCYEGIVTNVEIDGFGGMISCVGMGNTFDWYYLNDLLYPAPSVAEFSSTDILREVVNTNPYVKYQLGAIDGLDEWKTQQLTNTSGVGPRDWTDSNYTARQIIDEILAMGDYGYSDNDVRKVVLQVWERAVPKLKILKRDIGIDDTNFVIPRDCFGAKYSGFNLASDITETSGMVHSTYQDANGEFMITPYAMNPAIFRQIGPKQSSFSSSGKGDALNAIQVEKLDKQYMTGPGNIEIIGSVKTPIGGYGTIPVYKIRAGMILRFEDNLGNTPLYRNSVSKLGVFRVGSTTYSARSRKLTITIAQLPPIREFFTNQIEVS